MSEEKTTKDYFSSSWVHWMALFGVTFSLHYSYCLVDPPFSLVSLEWQGKVETAEKCVLSSSSTTKWRQIYIYFLFRLLLLGVCRVIKPTGPLDGLLGGRFLTAFAACLFTIGAKGNLIGWLVTLYGLREDVSITEIITLIFVISLPPLFMALFSTIGFSKSNFKLLIYKPEFIIMPTGRTGNFRIINYR